MVRPYQWLAGAFLCLLVCACASVEPQPTEIVSQPAEQQLEAPPEAPPAPEDDEVVLWQLQDHPLGRSDGVKLRSGALLSHHKSLREALRAARVHLGEEVIVFVRNDNEEVFGVFELEVDGGDGSPWRGARPFVMDLRIEAFGVAEADPLAERYLDETRDASHACFDADEEHARMDTRARPRFYFISRWSKAWTEADFPASEARYFR